MEAMAVLAAQYALGDNPSLDLTTLCRKANIAAKWINRQRVNTTESQMLFFKGKRRNLFKQWESAFRGTARDHMGQFCSKRDANEDPDKGNSRAQKKKKSKIDEYEDIFADFHSSV
jgi:hypothetical protein